MMLAKSMLTLIQEDVFLPKEKLGQETGIVYLTETLKHISLRNLKSFVVMQTKSNN